MALGSDHSTEDATSLLEKGAALLRQGAIAQAVECAESALRLSLASDNRHQQATALALLAHCDRLTSKLRRSIDRAQQAMHLFRSVDDLAGEIMSLATLCFASSCLGRGEDAVEAGMLCIQLSEQTEGALHQAVAYNNLGVALLCSQRFDDAMTALRVAESLSRTEASNLSPAQPLLNMVCAESFRLLVQRHYTGQQPDPHLLCRLVAQYEEAASGGVHAFQPGMDGVVEKASRTFTALSLCWQGKTKEAVAKLRGNRKSLSTSFTLSWMRSVDSLVRSEFARSAGDYSLALAHAREMIEFASSCQHEHLACLGLMLSSDLHLLAGKPTEAASELRALRQKEQAIRLESIRSRERAVQLQIEARALARSVEQLSVTAGQFEKMCFEDALTGLPNRRRFDEALQHQIALCAVSGTAFMSFIDVDRFKEVNDEHSHKVGDQVLRTVAQLMTAASEGAGVAYRIAGDEFAILFESAVTEHEVARRCRSLRDAVLSFDWDSLSSGLRVSLSIGTSAYKEGDTASAWLDRCDRRMYRAKRASRNRGDAPTSVFATTMR